MIHSILGSILSNVDIKELMDLLQESNELKTQALTKGDNIYSQGSPISSLYFLTSGLVRVYDLQAHHEINLRFLCDNSVVVPMYALTHTWQLDNLSTANNDCIATDTAQCVTECTFSSFPLTELDKLCKWSDKLKLELTLRHYRSMEERLRMLQLKTAFERYQTFVSTMPAIIVNNMPSHHVASYLGITPETLSRTRKVYNAQNC